MTFKIRKQKESDIRKHTEVGSQIFFFFFKHSTGLMFQILKKKKKSDMAQLLLKCLEQKDGDELLCSKLALMIFLFER